MSLRALASSSASDSDDHAARTRIILLVATGVILLILLGYLLCRRRRAKTTDASFNEGDRYAIEDSSALNTLTAFPPLDPAILPFKIEFERLLYTRKLASGAFGEVWLGQLDGTSVAIKQILPERRHDPVEIKCFLAEIGLMAPLTHPNILTLVGFSWSPEYNLCFATEYLKHGDLFSCLNRLHDAWSWPIERLQIALGVARGLVYLHARTPKVIHRDLKSRNILLDDRFQAKITDFGVSRTRAFEETMTAGVGTALWAAPEVFLGRRYDDKADVYSFGIVLSELDTGNIPFVDHPVFANGRKVDPTTVLKLVTMEHATPSFSPSCPAAIEALAKRCLSFEPSQRPSADDIVTYLAHAETHVFAF
ncbi:TKL protein kinase [Saprolegnia diclina VS20]|uniref:TKL protein kinase n=1 Tax=Saprolegnia diclina (strain VS20) TaxID=1156394 RepID=T0S380_SAPDV|nr:TKL protein kinase [Saprolegnia diclina VS20]EQC39453.1 TKL protein kinase [Saprolegnia diclina VS20]|eukprot:XP_008607514.1 TKL protein kinase [Saprolegnia diclina VS20]